MDIKFIEFTVAEDYAPWQKMHNYLQRYADLFHITERIRFQTKVILIDKHDLKNANIPWNIKIETIDGRTQTLQFDFVVVANGLFSTPYIPVFPGQKKFAGSIIHANDVKSHEQLENKRVVVIGTGNTATDSAIESAKYAQSCHLIFRRPHWLIPNELFHGYVPIKYIFTRLFTVINDPFPCAPHSRLYDFLHGIFSSFFNKIFDSISNDILAKYRSDLFDDKTFIPNYSLRHSENLVRLTEEFLEFIRKGLIIRKVASISGIIDDTTIRLDTGELIQADTIVCATGYIEQFSFLSDALKQTLTINTASSGTCGDKGIDLDLYRRIVPVGIPNIGFMGLNAVASQWLFFEVQSHWISDYFLGRIKLPDTEEEMYEEIRTIQHFMRKQFNQKSYYFQYYWLEPVEIYLQDMGVSLHRTNNWISEYFGVYGPKRLENLHAERQAKAERKSLNIWHRRWYFGFGHTILLILFLFLIRFLL